MLKARSSNAFVFYRIGRACGDGMGIVRLPVEWSCITRER
jgi:hypothetical protein